jgi:hypothetical protein
MNLDAEMVTQAGSGLVFSNTYGPGVSQAYRVAIVTAENELQAHFTNSVTVAMHFDLQPLGAGVSAQNTYQLAGASYADFAAALASHATTAADMLAVAGLPAEDPSHGAGFWIPSAEARVLGLSTDTRWVDDTVVLNSDQPNGFGKDTVATLEHEITEGVFGRVSSLGIAMTGWQPLDLFRFTADGARDYSGGADGQAAFFGVDGGHLSGLEFHNAVDASGANLGGDLGDWDTSADLGGPGGPGTVGALSSTDLQALDVLGWTPAASAATAGALQLHDAEPTTHIMTTVWGGWVEL